MIFAKYTFSEIKIIDILTFKTKNENERKKKCQTYKCMFLMLKLYFQPK